MNRPAVRALRYLTSILVAVGCLLATDPLSALAHSRWDRPDKLKKVTVA
jgi:hypothetical protein